MNHPHGRNLLGVILATMALGLTVIYLLARWSNMSRELSLLLSVGTTICGGTAIAIIAPLISAKEEETSYAITDVRGGHSIILGGTVNFLACLSSKIPL